MGAIAQAPKIVVLGSINMDLVARCANLPVPGQTLLANHFQQIPGGKGANQAIAASRCGGSVHMIGRLGEDSFAKTLVDNLERDHIDCQSVQSTADCSSGLALITVSAAGENQIVVIPGANALLSTDDVQRFASLIEVADCLLLQLEVPASTVAAAIQIARSCGTRIILDPAPAPTEQVPEDLFAVDLICPNETEASQLTGIPLENESALLSAAEKLHLLGAKAVAITLGEQGTLLYENGTAQRVPAFPVRAVDTTAAGDAFAGALAVRWAETNSLLEAVRFGNLAGALSAARSGAQPSIAMRSEIESLQHQQELT